MYERCDLKLDGRRVKGDSVRRDRKDWQKYVPRDLKCRKKARLCLPNSIKHRHGPGYLFQVVALLAVKMTTGAWSVTCASSLRCRLQCNACRNNDSGRYMKHLVEVGYRSARFHVNVMVSTYFVTKRGRVGHGVGSNLLQGPIKTAF